jgi:hypothetical protein
MKKVSLTELLAPVLVSVQSDAVGIHQVLVTRTLCVNIRMLCVQPLGHVIFRRISASHCGKFPRTYRYLYTLSVAQVDSGQYRPVRCRDLDGALDVPYTSKDRALHVHHVSGCDLVSHPVVQCTEDLSPVLVLGGEALEAVEPAIGVQVADRHAATVQVDS